ncbi:pterin-4a-carbinolamine dehydratase [Micromonospora palomenae]|uniref:Putative pterin-4-alpha-carbinolamine dehydratase n=1 Tax=Micromonospora palomenae TaxID=1461247 RepID=A0A561VN43_9ACTN|nr:MULTISPECIES: 4a-hydroxytetrahydrobiopterin dehydratase [Micromonospora]MDH6465167.1 4a-hydroxytetrahydrobiopterin dehydratase [Micromonospora sp. A200]TWG13020.1 pterin-4a-carbinolamine dehydratase [Micromonospora palomenae]
MRGLFNSRSKHDYLSDALTLLTGWTREGEQIRRTLVMDDTQHAALTERVKVVADALRLRPEISRRDEETQIRVGHGDGEPLTEGEVLLAARIEDAYRAVTAS